MLSDLRGESNDYFGSSVALSSDGNVVAIGARFHKVQGSQSGRVAVYQLIPTDSVWNEIGYIDGTDSNGNFGKSVAIAIRNGITVVAAGGGNKARVFESQSTIATSLNSGSCLNKCTGGDFILHQMYGFDPLISLLELSTTSCRCDMDCVFRFDCCSDFLRVCF